MNSNRTVKFKIFSKLYPEQKSIVRDIFYKPFSFLNIKAGRQSGKSFVLDRAAIGLSLKYGKKDILWITPSHGQSKDAFERMELLVSKVPGVETNRSNDNRSITFPNKTRIRFFSAERYDNLRGKHPDYVFLDEFAFFKEGAFEYAIKPYFIANKDLKVITASTPAGKNAFYDIWDKGNSQEYSSYINHILHYSMNPKTNYEFIEEERATMSPVTYKQEYEGEFVFGTSAVFGSFSELETITEWIDPVDGKRYFYGIDWSTGNGSDKTILTIIDEDGKVSFVYECEGDNEIAHVNEMIEYIIKYSAIGYSENNGIGSTCNTILADKLRGSNINASKIVNRFNTTQDSKQEGVQNLILDLNKGNISLPVVNLCPKLDNELSIFEVKRTSNGKLTYIHPKNRHDDYVDSLWLANLARRKLTKKSIMVSTSHATIKNGVFSDSNRDNGKNIPTIKRKPSYKPKKPSGGVF